MSKFGDERNKSLIDEREEYEKIFFSNIVDEMMHSAEFDHMIEERLDYLESHFDLEKLEEITILESKLDELDNNVDLKIYDNLIDSVVNTGFDEDEDQYRALIDEHINDERHFLDSILIEVIQEQDSFQKAIDEMILEHFEIQYEPEYFDYQPDYWYGGPPSLDRYWISDESVKDPFDSLGDIDYPEGYVEKAEPFDYREYPDYEDEIELMRFEASIETYEEPPQELETPTDEDLNRALDDISKTEKIFYVDIDDRRDKQLIEEKIKIESVFKEYFKSDDALDRIIREKLMEMKFNH